MLGKKKSLVGLDIGSRVIKAVELTEVRDQLKITGFGHSVVEDPDALQAEMTELIEKAVRAANRQ